MTELHAGDTGPRRLFPAPKPGVILPAPQAIHDARPARIAQARTMMIRPGR